MSRSDSTGSSTSPATSTPASTAASLATPNRSRLGLFVGILLASALALVGAGRLTDVRILTLLPMYMFSPLIAGVVTCLVHDVSVREVGLRLGRPRWIALAGVASLPMVGLTLLLAVLVPGVGFDPAADPVPGIALPAGAVGVLVTLGVVLALGGTINAVFAFGEEFGWRGYLLWELAPMGFWRASALIGALWGVWHAPAVAAGYNYPSFPLVGVGMMTVACLALSPLYTYLVVRADSVVAAALLHGVFNGSAGLVLAYTVTDSAALAELVASPVGVAGIAAFGLAAVVIAVSGAPTLNRSVVGAE